MFIANMLCCICVKTIICMCVLLRCAARMFHRAGVSLRNCYKVINITMLLIHLLFTNNIIYT